METYLKISYLNDFIFCPRSIYFHQLYGRASSYLYHTESQIRGKAAHKTVDQQQYTTAKHILQGLEVYSTSYQLCGKIDTFDMKKGLLTERKKKIKVIYDGYIFQLYAQYYCLLEMGYTVKSMKLYSLDDNKNYPVKLPDQDKVMRDKFMTLLQVIQQFDLNAPFTANPNKCCRCVYFHLCDHAL